MRTRRPPLLIGRRDAVRDLVLPCGDERASRTAAVLRNQDGDRRPRPPTPPLAYRRLPGAGGARLHGDHDPAAGRHAAALALPQARRRAPDLRRPGEFPHCSSATRLVGRASGTRCGTTSASSSSTCWCRTRSASLLAALLSMPQLPGRAFYRTAIFVPTMLSFVIVGFTWKLILSPLWGVAPHSAGCWSG